jgi:AcrR family transcriptional regulator
MWRYATTRCSFTVGVTQRTKCPDTFGDHVWSMCSDFCLNGAVAKRSVQGRPRAHAGESNAESHILEAAESLLAQKTLTELSVGDILAEAGVSRTTFYFYFSSKFAVVSTLLEKRSQEFFATLMPWLESRGDASPEVLRTAMLTNTQLFREHGPLMRAVIENLDSDPDLREQWMALINPLIDAGAAYIDAERAAGHYPPGLDSQLLSAGLLWAVERVQYISSLGIDPRLKSAEDVAEFSEALWRGTVMAGAPPAPVAPKARKRR